MMKLVSTTYNTNIHDIILLLFRITVGCALMTHGLPKLALLMAEGPVEFGDPIGVGPQATLILAVFAEVVCPLFIIIGLFVRLAVIPVIITMLVALFIIHAADAFGQKELALLYLITHVLLGVTGGGRFSIDQLIAGRRKKINY